MRNISVPSSLRVGPFVSNVLVKKRYLIFHFLNLWFSFLPPILVFWVYWQLFWDQVRPVHFYIYLPILIFFLYLTLAASALVFAKLLLIIVNAIHPPKEGVFLRDPSDKDYRYWSLRNVIKKWPFWICHRFPFPFLDNIAFKMFGVKTKFSNSLFEGWVDTEFMEIGKNVVVGQGAVVMSALIIGNFLIIRKTVIEDNVRIGAHAIVLPGTHIGKNCVLNTWSTTIVGQELEAGWIYNGGPAKKFKKNYFFQPGLEKRIVGVSKNMEELRRRYDEQYVKRHDVRLSIIDKMKRRKEIKKEEQMIWEKMDEQS
ncbi:MAG: DapH/DapD/GlmU-related protein [Promethearchaeota archaeon]